jgi:hypothetical protein
MEGMTTPANSFALNLHGTTVRLRTWLDQFLPCTGANGSSLRIFRPDEMLFLLTEVMRAGELLRGAAQGCDPSAEQEISDYRTEIERLRILLPNLQTSLLAERARLENERERLSAASDWIRTSRHTL